MKIINAVPKKYEDNDAYMNILMRVSERRYSAKPVSPKPMSAIRPCTNGQTAPGQSASESA